MKCISKRLLSCFVSCVWHAVISSQKYIVTRFLDMTHDLCDNTGQYFHESKNKLETKCYGRNWNIRIWVIYWFHMHALEYTETAAVPVVISPYRKLKVKHSITPTAFRRFFLFGLKRTQCHWIWYLSKLRLQNQLYSLLRYV